MRTLNLGILAHVDAGKTSLTERLLYGAGVIDEIGSVDDGSTQTDTLALERQRGITIKSAVVSFAVGDVTVNLIDTPGHPDFIAEVERVLSVLDGAVLVISAVEGVQSQTPLLMRALQRLGVPTLIFVNKLDRVGADPNRVLEEISARLTPAIAPMSADDQAKLAEVLADRDDSLLIAYVRMFSGTVHARERLNDEKVTAISVFDAGDVEQRASVSAGEIAKLWGLGSSQIGDRIGEAPPPRREFAPPTLESVVVPTDADDGAGLRVALGQLAEQDPLIEVRQNDERHEMSVSLYGEVQKEVIQATLAEDYGIDVEFHETTPLYMERVRGVGEALEILNTETNPYGATIGLRVEPARQGSGLEFRLEVDHRQVPLYAFKKLESFGLAMEEYVREQLQEGLYGWRVPDCVVTMTDSNYSSPDGPQSTRGPLSTPADFRKLTPIVVMRALESAGTVVCEPTARVGLEVPTHAVGAVIPALARLGAPFEPPAPNGERSTITAVLPATRADELHRELPALTGGEGVLDSSFAGYQPVSGDPPTRRRTRPNPLSLVEYVARVERRLGP